jgi:hypothetical protein
MMTTAGIALETYPVAVPRGKGKLGDGWWLQGRNLDFVGPLFSI